VSFLRVEQPPCATPRAPAGPRLASAPLPPLPLQHGATPLHGAAASGHAPVVAALLAHPRVEVNAKDEVRWGERAEGRGRGGGAASSLSGTSAPPLPWTRASCARLPSLWLPGRRSERTLCIALGGLCIAWALVGGGMRVRASRHRNSATAFEWAPLPHRVPYLDGFPTRRRAAASGGGCAWPLPLASGRVSCL